jgi:CRP-like cAMP-binding protein
MDITINHIAPVCECEGCQLKTLFFTNINKDQLGVICDHRYEMKFRKGDIIAKQGDEIQDFMYLKTGLVKIFKTDNHHDQILTIAKPLDFVSMLSVFSDKLYQYSITAIENTTICNIKIDIIKKLIEEDGNFALNLLTKLSKATDSLINVRVEISKKNLRGRIAYILNYFADNIYKSQSFELPLSRKEIAEWISMTTENVIRIMSEFRQDKIIVINGKIIDIINKEKLNKICDVG